MPVLSAEQHGGSTIKAFLQSCRDWVRGGRALELSCVGETEVARIARDVGMTVAELRLAATQGSAAADLLFERMGALDLDPEEVFKIAPETLRDLQRTCTLCESKRRCARDLARDAEMPVWKDYCPNAETLTALNGLPWASRREW